MSYDPADRIRKLRAKADSTTFPAEREALLAKAAELMIRHGVHEDHLHPPETVSAPPPAPPPPAPEWVVVNVVIHDQHNGNGYVWSPTGTASTFNTTWRVVW